MIRKLKSGQYRLYSRNGLFIVLCCLAVACSSAASSNAPAVVSSAADSASVHRAAVAVLTAFDSLQWDRFRSYFADDMTAFFPFAQSPARATNRAAVEETFGSFMTRARTAMENAGRPAVQGLRPRDLHVQMISRDAAVVTFHLGAAATPSRRTFVFRRTGADEWKVVHLHASPTPPAPPQ